MPYLMSLTSCLFFGGLSKFGCIEVYCMYCHSLGKPIASFPDAFPHSRFFSVKSTFPFYELLTTSPTIFPTKNGGWEDKNISDAPPHAVAKWQILVYAVLSLIR